VRTRSAGRKEKKKKGARGEGRGKRETVPLRSQWPGRSNANRNLAQTFVNSPSCHKESTSFEKRLGMASGKNVFGRRRHGSGSPVRNGIAWGAAGRGWGGGEANMKLNHVTKSKIYQSGDIAPNE